MAETANDPNKTPPDAPIAIPRIERTGRLNEPMTTGTNSSNPPLKPIESGLGPAILPQWAVIMLTLLVVLAGAVPAALVAAGITLPGWVTAIGAIIVTLGTALGITSPGLRKKE
jgi:hypothetical protein